MSRAGESLDELKRTYGKGDRPIPPALIRRLRTDSRKGANKLAESLDRIRARHRRERRRIASFLDYERRLWESGIDEVAGVDEVGMGPMAGPVVAAAVVFTPETWIDGVNDSKLLTPDQRAELDGAIRRKALRVAVGVVDPPEVDRRNVYHAGLEAMRRAVADLSKDPGHVLVDSRTIPDIGSPQSGIVRGDSASFTIAAASIVAKVHRDSIMNDLDARYPGYGFARNKGYCTRQHQAAVQDLGPSPVHRHSYNFIRELVGEYSDTFYSLRDRTDQLLTRTDLDDLEADVRTSRSRLSPEEKRKLHLLIRRRRSRTGMSSSRET